MTLFSRKEGLLYDESFSPDLRVGQKGSKVILIEREIF